MSRTNVISPELQGYIDKHLTHQIHTSERRAFRSCRRRWDWVYNDMYSPNTTPQALEFGIAFHAAMEVFYEPKIWLQDLDIKTNLALVKFKQECDKQLKKYKKLNPDPDITVIASYKERVELGLGMIRHYCKVASPRYDSNWTPIAVEVSFEVPINDPDTNLQLWCKCDKCWKNFKRHLKENNYPKELLGGVSADQEYVRHDGSRVTLLDLINKDEKNASGWKGLPVTYGGRLDALFSDEHGRYWIADWKTTARMLDEDVESSFLQLDDQIVSYIWALNLLGIECAGFVYVEIKKAYPQPPEILTRSYKGRMLSTNKQNLTTYDMFLETAKKHDYAAWHQGFYNDYLLWLKGDGPRFTERHQIHKNPNEIQEAGRVIALEAMDMIGSPRIYPQPGKFSCNWCLFKQPCIGKNMGEDYVYTLDSMFEKRTMMYWQEKELSTE